MSKNRKIAEEKEKIEKALYDFPNTIDPCPYCRLSERKTIEELEICQQCCYYYPSQFKLGEK